MYGPRPWTCGSQIGMSDVSGAGRTAVESGATVGEEESEREATLGRMRFERGTRMCREAKELRDAAGLLVVDQRDAAAGQDDVGDRNEQIVREHE